MVLPIRQNVRKGFQAVYFSSVGFHHRQFGCIELIRQTGSPLRSQTRSGHKLPFTAVNQLITLERELKEKLTILT